MRRVNKMMIIIMLILAPVSVVALNIAPQERFEKTKTENGYFDISPTYDEVHFIDIPEGKTFKGYEIIKKEETKEPVDETPIQKFYPTNASSLKSSTFESVNAERVYDEPFTFDIIKKGNKNTVRVFAPSIYYDEGYQFETTNITLRVYFEEDDQSYQPMDYQHQNPDYEYVIVTNESFWQIIHDNFKSWKLSTDNKVNDILIINVSTILNQSNCSVNGTWGDGTNTTEGNLWIEDGKELTSDWEMFNDTQAKIRNFLRYCYTIHGTRYALLFGNRQIVPPRMVCSYAAGTCPGCTDFYNDTSHASDMYYSCLHHNMNNNTNSYWMENAVCGSPVDEIDWGYDLHVGRVLVNQKFESMWWINKTKNYVNGANQTNYTQWNVVPCKNNANAISNQTWTGWTGSELGPSVGDEFPSNMSFINEKNITQAQWTILDDYANGNAGGIPGFVLIYHAGHGGTLWDPYSDANLDNMGVPNFVITEGCSSANFGEDTSSRMEDWMSNNGAAFGGIANSAYGWFVASTYYGEQMMKEMFSDGNTSIFSVAYENAKEKIGHDPDCVWGQIVKDGNFFGDPALEWNWYQEESNDTIPQFIDINGGTNHTDIHTATPTFNWTSITNTSQYNLQISNDSAFTQLVANIIDINIYVFPTYYSVVGSNISFTLPPEYALTDMKSYYCKVRAMVSEEGR